MSLPEDFITSLLGEQISNYRLIALLTTGGFSAIYLGQHVVFTDRYVAVKVLLDRYLYERSAIAQFMQEAVILNRVRHPYIIQVIDTGTYQNHPYIITPYMPNGTLDELLERRPVLTREEIETILSQVGSAIIHAHAVNIVHCDIKPGNILLNASYQARLADFGIAEVLTGESKVRTSVQGSYDYMSPEQFKKIISKHCDQYAFGCLAYLLWTGHLPFEGQSFQEVVHKRLYEDPIPPGYYNPAIPTHVEKAILRAMARESDQRYKSVFSFMQAMRLPVVDSGKKVIYPKSKEQWASEGFTHGRANRFKEAIEAFNEAIQLDPSYTKPHFGKGLVFYTLKRYHAALECFTEATRCNPRFAAAYDGRGNALYSLGRYEEAIIAYDQAIYLNPRYAEAFYNKSLALQHLKMRREEAKMYKKARQLGFRR